MFCKIFCNSVNPKHLQHILKVMPKVLKSSHEIETTVFQQLYFQFLRWSFYHIYNRWCLLFPHFSWYSWLVRCLVNGEFLLNVRTVYYSMISEHVLFANGKWFRVKAFLTNFLIGLNTLSLCLRAVVRTRRADSQALLWQKRIE